MKGLNIFIVGMAICLKFISVVVDYEIDNVYSIFVAVAVYRGIEKLWVNHSQLVKGASIMCLFNLTVSFIKIFL